MKNIRKYGEAPFSVAVIHGGPGGSGSVALVAKELAHVCGVLEPLQTQKTINGQLQELKKVIEEYGTLPIILIGWSWGAWLSYLFAAYYPAMVKKLILVSSGPFEERYVQQLQETRLNRLNAEEKIKLQVLKKVFDDPAVLDKNVFFSQFGELMDRSDTYEPLPVVEKNTSTVQFDIYQAIWPEAAALRKSGELLKLGEKIVCPVIAIHGDYDPHPAAGVEKPLSRVIKNFKFILLKNCGHTPWIEKKAKNKFYEILKKEVTVP